MSRFFIALIPPQHILDYVNQVKQYFADNYNSRSALKSPPHITLQPPFQWHEGNVTQLEEHLKNFASNRTGVPVILNQYGAFPPRVIYIDVINTPELIALQSDLITYMESIGIYDPNTKTRTFTPHMTVAFRDLTKQNFKVAWQEFEHRQINFEFGADNICLLLHDGKRWNVLSKFQFS
ncbi:MAG: 2'-5' RNA ligase family protein [Calothrix sp. FI2-JRJ7]|jgi:2'-5' RNA ligase|nr:2'-5' RNA ligase family protein [Calothrix sp. FI2-JRJ7]